MDIMDILIAEECGVFDDLEDKKEEEEDGLSRKQK